jgi:hypothetical protein
VSPPGNSNRARQGPAATIEFLFGMLADHNRERKRGPVERIGALLAKDGATEVVRHGNN